MEKLVAQSGCPNPKSRVMSLLCFSQTPLTGSTESQEGGFIHTTGSGACLAPSHGYSVSCTNDPFLGSDHQALREGQALGG